MSLFTSPTKQMMPRFCNSPKLVLVDVAGGGSGRQRRSSSSAENNRRGSLGQPEDDASARQEQKSPIKRPERRPSISKKCGTKDKSEEEGGTRNSGEKQVLATPTKSGSGISEDKSAAVVDDNTLGTPKSTRPSRLKSTPNRFGIDDLRLEDVVSATPPSKRIMASAEEASGAVGRADNNTPKSSGKKLRSKTSRAKRASMAQSSGGRRFKVSHVTDSQVESMIADVRRSSSKKKSTKDRSFAEEKEDDEAAAPVSASPAPTWQVADQQPGGTLKLKLRRSPLPQRQLKPQQLRRIQASDQRLSRQVASEIGISPNRLRGLMFGSPSPKRRRGNDTQGTSSSSSSLPVGRGHAPLTPVGLYDLTTSPLVTEKRDGKDARKGTRSSSRKRLSYL